MVTLIEWAKEDNIIVEPLIVRIFNKNYIGKPLENLILSETNKAIGEIMDGIRNHIPRRFYCILEDGTELIITNV